jgi:flagellar capping protein FliD
VQKSLKQFLIFVLCASLLACSPTTLSTIENLINEFIPVVTAIVNIVVAMKDPAAIAQVQAVEAKITTTTQEIETLAATINASNAVGVRAQIVADVAAVEADLSSLEAAAGITNPASKLVVSQFVILGGTLLTEIVNALPTTASGPKEFAKSKSSMQASVTAYKHRYNQILKTKTGDAVVDGVLAKQKLFRHRYGLAF